MTPNETLKKTKAYFENLQKAKKSFVKVGLPVEKVGGKAYGNGQTVIEVGARHEFGEGVPVRSFLRVPFSIKNDEIKQYIANRFKAVYEGSDAEKELGLIGEKGKQISHDAFSSKGYGTWEDLKPATIRQKGSSTILIDKGILRASITYIVGSE